MERLKTFFSRLSTAQVISLAVLLLLIAVVPVLVAFNRQQQTTSQQAALITNPICTTICPSLGLGIPCRVFCTTPTAPAGGCVNVCPTCTPGTICPRIACSLRCLTPTASSQPLTISSVTLDKSSVPLGGTITATATLTNNTSSSVTVLDFAIGGIPPGGTLANGPYDSFPDELPNLTLTPGQSRTLTSARTFPLTDTTAIGQWLTYAAYEDASQSWNNSGPVSNFTVTSPTSTSSPTANPTFPSGCINVCPTCVPGQICPQFACFFRCPTPTRSGGTPAPTNPQGGSPTSGPTSTPTSGQGGTQLAFTIFLGGIGNAGDNSNPNATGNQNPNRTQRTLTVFLFDGNGQPVTQATGPINYVSANGNFTGTIGINNLPSGNYIVKVKTDQFLRKQLPGILHIDGQQTNTMPSVTLIAGDIAPVPQGDNALSLLDYNILIGCFSDLQPAQSCTDAQKLSADLNDDGKVNEVDYNEFLRNLAVQNGD